MPVYVDNMRAKVGRMIMCHMMADTTEELLDMADKIGLNRKWLQNPGTLKEHFDVALVTKNKAIKAGAIEVSMMDLGRLMLKKNKEKS